jgi:hypothetical protein
VLDLVGGVDFGVYDRNDDDAVGYSLHTSLCGWPGVITKWNLLRCKPGFSLRLACVHDGFLGNVIPIKCISVLFMPPITAFVRCLCFMFADVNPLSCLLLWYITPRARSYMCH